MTRFLHAFFDLSIWRQVAGPMIREGLRMTIVYAVLAEILGMALGMAAAFMRLSRFAALRLVAAAYVDVLRGLPLLMTIMLIGFGLPLAGLPPRSAFAAGVTALSLVAGAYLAETFRAGIQSIERGQTLAALSLGMSNWTAMRTVVLPQAIRRVIPPLVNEFIALLKDTSLVAVLGTVVGRDRELLRVARDGVGFLASPSPFMLASLMYLAVTLPLTRLVAVIERRVRVVT
jgi:His/Glu/Gln/Arg/opine family amino acid ABC transporter permease subunit